MSKTTYPVGEKFSRTWYFAEFDELPDAVLGKKYLICEKIGEQSAPKILANGYCESEANIADVKLMVDALNEKRFLAELGSTWQKYSTKYSSIDGGFKDWWTDTDHSD